MVDKPKLDQMLSNLRRYVSVLKTLSRESAETFLDNPDKIGKRQVSPRHRRRICKAASAPRAIPRSIC